jgi:tetratricopeptide (TPR) repeat protein
VVNRWRLVRVRRELAMAAFWRRRADLYQACLHAHRALVLARRLPAPLAADVAMTVARLERDRDSADAALALLTEAVDMLESAPPATDRDRVLVLALVAVSDAHRRAARYPQATRTLRRALRLAEAVGEPGPLTAVVTVLGITAKELGAFAEAARHYARVADLHAVAGASAADAASLEHNRAGLAHAQRRHADAEAHARRAVALRRQVPGHHAVDVAEDLAVLAAAIAGQGRHAEASLLLEDAMQACQAAVPPRRYEIAVHLHNLAAIDQAAGRPADAERRYREAHSIKEELLGQNHPEVARVMNNLATLLREQRRDAEALACLNRALAIAERIFDPYHPMVRAIRDNLRQLER